MIDESQRLFWVVAACAASILLVLAIRNNARRLLGAEAAYAIWLLVPLSTLALAVPTWKVQVLNPIASSTVVGMIQSASPQAAPLQWFDVDAVSELALLVWFIGGVVMGAVMMTRQWRFARRLKQGACLSPSKNLIYTQKTTQTSATHTRTLIKAGELSVWTAAVPSPALCGLLKPRIVLPLDFQQRYQNDEQEMILAHEHAHWQRFDVLANLLCTLWQCVFWFLPWVPMAAKRFRIDQEFACDARVLRQFPGQASVYAKAMLKTQLVDSTVPAVCAWQVSHPLKERIQMLQQHPFSIRRRISSYTVVLLSTLGLAGMAYAMQPARVVEATNKQITAIGGELSAENGSGNRLNLPVDEVSAGNHDNIEKPTTQSLQATQPSSASHDAKPLIQAPSQSPQDPVILKHQPPKYPLEAVRLGKQGEVKLKILIGADGLVKEVHNATEDASVDASLVLAAIENAKTWTFAPARNESGSAVEQWVHVPVAFSLDEKGNEGASEADQTIQPSSGYQSQQGKISSQQPTQAKMAQIREIALPSLPDLPGQRRYFPVQVDVLALVTESGQVKEVSVRASDAPSRQFEIEALRAVRNAQFEPARDINGNAIESWVQVPIAFNQPGKINGVVMNGARIGLEANILHPSVRPSR